MRSRFSILLLLAILSVAPLACSSSDGSAVADAGVDAGNTSKITEAEVLEACVRIAACDVEKRPRLGDCFYDFFDNKVVQRGQRTLFEPMYRCANKAGGDCGKIRECLGFDRKLKKCSAATFVPRCDGDTAMICDGSERRLDCAAGGLKCGVKQVGTTSDAVCGGGPCTVGTDKVDCRDSKLWQCTGGAWEIFDCPEANQQCRDPSLGVCEGRGRSCRSFAAECQGNKIVECLNGYVAETDCSAISKRKCDATQALCVAGGTECATDTFFDTCEGDELVVCIDGFKGRVNCKSAGFLGCEKDADGPGSSCKAAPVYN